jgi:uncharacterized membrane protein YcaP (DUF421 family)
MKHYPVELIIEGKRLEDSLQERKISKEWLMEELKRQGYHSLDEVFYAVIGTNGRFICGCVSG